MTGTSGGPPRIELIGDLEEQILGLVPIECVEGQQEVSESTVDFQFNPANVRLNFYKKLSISKSITRSISITSICFCRWNQTLMMK